MNVVELTEPPNIRRAPEVRRCMLHIGAPKTGTSAIQSWLAKNREALLNLGVHYPRCWTDRTARHDKMTSGNAIEIARYLQPSVPLRYELNVNQTINGLETSLNTNYPTVLYSSEWLGNVCDFTPLLDLCGRYGRTIGVIYYVRNVADYFRANYMQALKRQKETRTLREFSKTFRLPYLSTLNTIQNFLDTENVLVRSYDDARKDLVADFLYVLGIGQDQHVFDTHQMLVNPSLTLSEMEVLRFLNQGFKHKSESAQIAGYMLEKRQVNPKPIPIDDETLAILRNRFRAEIDAINEMSIVKSPVEIGSALPSCGLDQDDTIKDVLFDIFKFEHHNRLVAQRKMRLKQARLDEIVARSDQQDDLVKRLTQRLKAIEESTSWRITRPLRNWTRLARNISSFICQGR